MKNVVVLGWSDKALLNFRKNVTKRVISDIRHAKNSMELWRAFPDDAGFELRIHGGDKRARDLHAIVAMKIATYFKKNYEQPTNQGEQND